MPLSEFLRMARGKLESNQSRPEDDLVELVWENGQIMMQGQSIRASRGPIVKARETGVANAATAKIGKFGVAAESVLNDMSSVVPSGDLDFGQDDEMAPWLSYPIDAALAQDYGSPLLPEISGLTVNGCEQNTIKALSSKSHLLWQQPQHHQASDFVGSGVSDIVSKAAISGNRNTVNNYTSMKMGSQSVGQQPINSSNFLNFSNFARPASLVKHNFFNSDAIPTSASLGMERMVVNEKGSLAASGSNTVKSTLVEQFGSARKDIDFNASRQPVFKAPERTENLCRDTNINNDKPLVQSSAANSVKIVVDGERTVEPMVASSSVGSGNSADRVSCEQTHNSKRKFRDIEESECRSDDIETESLGTKKPNLGRGGIGSKRSRAAEVHNLSERRRRDRINEKMRALQELIPNCNKADKASMLDEAIEYLKTLQLQVQIMSMGAGLCMPQMMFPMGMPRMHPSHFPPMGIGMGMGMGMGFGMDMLDINGGSSRYPVYPVPPMQLPHFSSPMSGPTNFHRMPNGFPVYGHPSQGIADSVPRAPLVPPAMGVSALRNGVQNEVPSTSSVVNSKDPNLPLMCNAEAGSSVNHKSSEMQATNVALDQSAAVEENKQATDTRTPTPLTSTSATDISKEPGYD